MPQKSRELSQFGSFLEVDNSNQNIGITTAATPYIGIGTTNPTVKLTVVGDTNISGSTTIGGNIAVSGNANVSGVVSATSYYLNGNSLIDAALQTWDLSGSNVYRLQGNVGIGTSVFPEKLTVVGNVSAGQYISTVTTGISPLSVTSQTLVTNLNADYLRGGIPGSNINSFDIATLGATQTLSNKTLVAPKISSISNVGTLNLPTTNGTLVSTGDTAVVTSNMIADLSITNTDVAVGAAISYSKLNLSNTITNSDIASGAAISISKLASSTISGVSLGNNLNNLTAGSFITYNSGSTYNGSSAITISVAATTTNTANTVVARNASGDFTAGTVSLTNLSASQTVQSNLLSVTGSSSLSGTVSIGGSIGIGTTSPKSALHVAGADGNNIYMDVRGVPERQIIFDNGSTYCYFYLNSSSSPQGESFGFIDNTNLRNLWFYTPSNSVIRVGDTIYTDISSSRVGVGTTTPTAKLHVNGGGSAASSAPIKISSGSAVMATPEAGAIEYDGTTLYATPNTSFGRAVIPTTLYTSGTGVGGVTGSTNYALFSATNDTITLPIGTYLVRMRVRVAVSGSTVSSALNINLRGSGNAQGTFTWGGTGAILDAGAASSFIVSATNLGTNITVTAASAANPRQYIAIGEGILKVVSAGTIIPSYQYGSTLTSGSTTLVSDNYMIIQSLDGRSGSLSGPEGSGWS